MEWVGSLSAVTEHEIRVVLFRDGEHYLAQGIELDICAQGPSWQQALKRFEQTVNLQADEDEHRFYAIAPAPEKFYLLWVYGPSQASGHSGEKS